MEKCSSKFIIWIVFKMHILWKTLSDNVTDDDKKTVQYQMYMLSKKTYCQEICSRHTRNKSLSKREKDMISILDTHENDTIVISVFFKSSNSLKKSRKVIVTWILVKEIVERFELVNRLQVLCIWERTHAIYRNWDIVTLE